MRAPVYVSQRSQWKTKKRKVYAAKGKNKDFRRFFFAKQNGKNMKHSCHMVGVTSQNDALERMIHASWLVKCAAIDEVLSAYRRLIEYWRKRVVLVDLQCLGRFSALQRTRATSKNLPNNKNLRLNSCAASLSLFSSFLAFLPAREKKNHEKYKMNREQSQQEKH